tara:strand:+ start:1437 stop:1934 length:498 start_codon:yes stop_codon:yes gene_type:complete
MTINTTTLEANLTTKINATSGSTDGKEFLLLGKAVEALLIPSSVTDMTTEGASQVTAIQAAGAAYALKVEDVFTVSGITPALDPGDGTIQFWALTAASTPTFDSTWQNGESVTFMITDGTSYTITWPTTNWLGGEAPTLEDAGHNVFVIWKAGNEFYGAKSGLYA